MTWPIQKKVIDELTRDILEIVRSGSGKFKKLIIATIIPNAASNQKRIAISEGCTVGGCLFSSIIVIFD